MNVYPTEMRALRLLASLRGGYLHLDSYDRAVGQRLEKTHFPLSRSELNSLIRALEEKGLVASVLERLDGQLVALTVEGRSLMEAQGATFDAADVEKTRARFNEWLCKANM